MTTRLRATDIPGTRYLWHSDSDESVDIQMDSVPVMVLLLSVAV